MKPRLALIAFAYSVLILTALWGQYATARASEKINETDFLFALGERIISESCQRDSIYSQCIGQSGTKCENGMLSGLDKCVKQLTGTVPDLDVDPRLLGDDKSNPYYTLGQDMGLCLTDGHLDSIDKDRESVYDCLYIK